MSSAPFRSFIKVYLNDIADKWVVVHDNNSSIRLTLIKNNKSRSVTITNEYLKTQIKDSNSRDMITLTVGEIERILII